MATSCYPLSSAFHLLTPAQNDTRCIGGNLTFINPVFLHDPSFVDELFIGWPSNGASINQLETVLNFQNIPSFLPLCQQTGFAERRDGIWVTAVMLLHDSASVCCKVKRKLIDGKTESL